MSQLGICLQCEHKKSKRRFLPLILVGVLCFYGAYFLKTLSKPQNQYTNWAAVFYNLSVINTLLLPITISSFTSRLFDAEHRGHTWKLLETVVSRKGLFLSKLLYGALQLTVFLLLKTLVVLAIVHFFLNDAPYPALHWTLRYIADTLSVSLILFFLHAGLSLVFPNQAISILVSVGGSLLGFLFLFLDKRIFYLFNPWSLYGATGFARLNWIVGQPHHVWYTYDGTAPHAHLAVLFWLLVTFFLDLFLLRHFEEDNLFHRIKGKFVVLSTRAPRKTRLPNEFLKLRRTPIWLAFFLLPVLSAAMGTLNYLGNLEILKGGWYDLWSQHTLFLGLLFLPMLIALFSSYQWSLERKGTNWIPLRLYVSPTHIVCEKAVVSGFFVLLCLLWIVLLFLSSGFLAGIDGSLPPALWEWVICGIGGGVTLCLFQLFLSLVLQSFILPVVVCVLPTVGFFWIAAHNERLIYAVPHALLFLGIRANNPYLEINLPFFFASCLFWSAVSIFGCVLYLKKTDVKTR